MIDPLQTLWNQVILPRAGALTARLVFSLLAVAVVVLVARLALGTTRRALSRTRAHANARLLVNRIVEFTFILVAAVWVLAIFGVQLTALVAVLGVAGLAFSLALQDVLRNLVAGLYLLIERPFTIGDQIEFKTFSGVVETIELRTTALRTSGGQRVVIPNAMLFSDALVNRSAYGRQLMRLRVAVPPAAEATDGFMAEVRRAVEAAAQRHPSDSAPPATVLVESLGDQKVTLRVELWTSDARTAAPDIAWSLREQLPKSEVTVLE
jgi:small-conductance mechanosensitive channel